MRKPIIAGNWKMNMTPSEAEALVTALLPLVREAACEVVVCPPFVDLAIVGKCIAGSNIRLGAQNIHWAQGGAFTGEISTSMLKELGVAYAIIGHSERRQYFGETDESVNARVRTAIEAGIIPILCVGESLTERENGETEALVTMQVERALQNIPGAAAAEIVIAYEPIWAIGTGRTATDAQANETIGVIRSVITRLYGAEVAEKIRIQYGGSMNPKNVKGLMDMPEIDGGLIGGASLKAADFAQVVNYDK